MQTPLDEATGAYNRGDFEEAYRLNEPLARQGFREAQRNLAVMFERGRGVRQDLDEALKWYRKAAEQGLADVQFNLGRMHSEGKVVPRDYAEAAKWYRKAAEQGMACAQFRLGNMYLRGLGVPQDPVLAYLWFELAASGLSVSGRVPEEATREKARDYRDLAASNMNLSQIARARQSVRDWMERNRPIGAV